MTVHLCPVSFLIFRSRGHVQKIIGNLKQQAEIDCVLGDGFNFVLASAGDACAATRC